MSEIILRIKEEYASLATDISTYEYESLKQSLKKIQLKMHTAIFSRGETA